jgi:hypothetical protein
MPRDAPRPPHYRVRDASGKRRHNVPREASWTAEFPRLDMEWFLDHQSGSLADRPPSVDCP